MLRIYVAQQRQLLRMARKITLPQTDCRQGSKRWLLSSGNSVWSGNSVSTGSSISRCTPLACDSRSSFSLDTSVLMAVAKACLVGQVGLVCSSVSSTLHLTMRSIGMRFTQFLLVGHLRLDGSSESVSRWAGRSRLQLCLINAPSAYDTGRIFSSDRSVLRATVKSPHRAYNQRFRLMKDSHLPQERGKETRDFQRICTGFIAPRGQRLGEHQRRTA